jgi:hypothetical protein
LIGQVTKVGEPNVGELSTTDLPSPFALVAGDVVSFCHGLKASPVFRGVNDIQGCAGIAGDDVSGAWFNPNPDHASDLFNHLDNIEPVKSISCCKCIEITCLNTKQGTEVSL